MNKMIWNKDNKIYYGGDYNPDQWSEATWQDDMEKLKELKANMITLPVFSWAKIQPDEHTFNFDWLDKIIKMAEEADIMVNIATPTAAQPAWMSKKYPEMLPTDKFGNKRMHGGRSNFCPNSKEYRRLSKGVALKMAEHYKDTTNIVLWHVNNEYGTYCYCENCRQAFIEWLKDKYVDLGTLNEKWYTDFWGHTYYDWDEIQVVSALTELLPNRLGNRDGTNFQGMAVDYRRFLSDSIIDCYKNEAEAIKTIIPDAIITTNIWGVAPWIDLHKMGEAVDVVSWDSYPSNSEHYSVSSFKNDVIRSLKKGQNFILMEQTPNQQNWQDYNALKRPGVMRLMSYQTMAHGADALLFFQVRQSRGACEKYHAALIPHVGHLNTRIGHELKHLGNELDKISQYVVGTKIKAEVAIVMDWDNWWSVEYSSGPSIDLNYFDTLHSYYKVLNGLNIEVDIIKPNEDMSSYKMVIAPLLNMMSKEAQSNIESYVRKGGTFVSTYFSGCVDEYDLVHLGGYPGALKDVMGIWVEEVDALYKGSTNQLIPNSKLSLTQQNYDCSLICELIHLQGAEAMAYYGDDYYKYMPAITRNQFGEGQGVYIGTQPEEKMLKEMIHLLAKEKGVLNELPMIKGVEFSKRHAENTEYLIIMNHNEHQISVDLIGKYINVLNDRMIKDNIDMNGKDVAILCKVEETL